MAAAHRTDEQLAATFPMLAEVPELGEVLAAAQAVDRLVARLVAGLLELTAHGVAEATTGVAIDQWLALVAGRTHADRRMLLTTCDVLRRLPSLRSAFLNRHAVSWAQVRAVVLQVVRLPHRLDEVIDQAVGDAILRSSPHTDPDELTRAISISIASLEAADEPTDPTRPDREEFLALQPRLDGTGGQIYGEYNAINFATLDAALAPDRRDLDAAADHDDPTADVHDRDPHGDHDPDGGHDPAGDRRGRVHSRPGRWDHGTVGRARARRLIDLLTDDDRDGAHTGDGGTDGRGARAAGRPQLLVRIDLSTLLGDDQLPAELLTTLTGGRMWADAATVRQLIDQRGADLRTVVLDDTGTILGVGRRTRVAPDWLADAVLARHTTCTHPTCQTAARSGDLDHATPWWPPDGGAGGSTDQANLAPVCARHNRRKEPDGWRATQHPDGHRTWHHPRSGLTADVPPDPRPRTVRSRGPTAGTDPPAERTDVPTAGTDPPA